MKYALFLAVYYVANAAYQNFMTLYLQDVGLATKQIGALMALVPLVSIFSQPLWGMIGDKSNNRTNVLRILIGASAALVLAFYAWNNYIYLLLLIGVYASFYIAIQPMGDSIILESLGRMRRPFGPLRLSGCLAFGLASYFLGALFNGRSSLVPGAVAALLCLAFMGTFALPKVGGHDREKNAASIRTLFKNRELVLLLILLALLQMTMGFFYAFFSLHFRAISADRMNLLGICYLISAFSEIPFLLMADRLIKRLGAGKLMCISASVLTARFLILAFAEAVPVVMASQVLHGWGFIVMTVSMAKYMNDNVPDELKSRAQMLLGVIGFGIARTVGTFGGGYLAELIGFQGGFLLNAGIAFLALVLFAPRFLRTKKEAT